MKPLKIEEYGFEKIKGALYEGSVPNQLDFDGGSNENFVQACNFLSPSNDNRVYCFCYI